MTIGQRIKLIRQYHGMTQKAFGLLLGFPEKSADVRIAQYENGSRIPKKSMIEHMTGMLGISPVALSLNVSCSRDEFMHSIFCMEKSEGSDVIYDCIKEWETMRIKYETGEISSDDYCEWKLTYPVPYSK